MSRPVINPGTLHWSGEHWINYLRRPDSESNSAMVSLYHTRYSPAGEGNVAFVDIADQPAYQGVYSDNPEVATFVRQIISGRGNPFDQELPLYPAQLVRTGDIRQAPGWLITTDTVQIQATWQKLKSPIIAEGPAPTFGPDRDFFTVLFFTWMATIQINGQLCPGQPYARDIWQPSIGGQRSSCVFALAETMILTPT